MIKQIGQSIRNARESRGLTQGQLAEMTGLSLATISRMESDVAVSSMTSYYLVARELDMILWVQMIPVEGVTEKVLNRGEA